MFIFGFLQLQGEIYQFWKEDGKMKVEGIEEIYRLSVYIFKFSIGGLFNLNNQLLRSIDVGRNGEFRREGEPDL